MPVIKTLAYSDGDLEVKVDLDTQDKGTSVDLTISSGSEKMELGFGKAYDAHDDVLALIGLLELIEADLSTAIAEANANGQ